MEDQAYVGLGLVAQLREAVDKLAERLDQESLGAVDRVERLDWQAGGYADLNRSRGSFNSVAVVNESDGDCYVGTGAPGAGASAGTADLVLPGRSWVVLPIRAATVSVGGPAAGRARVVQFTRSQAFAMGTIAEAPTATEVGTAVGASAIRPRSAIANDALVDSANAVLASITAAAPGMFRACEVNRNNGTGTFALQLIRGGVTYAVRSGITSSPGELHLGMETGDVWRLIVTTAGTAGHTADVFLSAEEYPAAAA